MNTAAKDEDEIERPHTFQVEVHVLQARHLKISHGNVDIKLSIGKVTKTVRAKVEQNSNFRLNKIFNLSFHLLRRDFLSLIIRIAMYKVTAFRLTQKLLGSCEIPIASIWAQPNHQYYHKWASLTKTNDAELGQQGVLKCNIFIISNGQSPSFIPDHESSSDIDNNFIIPAIDNLHRRQAHYTLTVYRADGITWRRKNRTHDLLYKYLYVKVTFGDITQRTNLCQQRLYPVWNEALTFLGSIPSIYTAVHIDLWDKKYKYHIGRGSLNIAKFFGQFEDSFILPQFGPGFLYLYHDKRKHICSVFAGRVLLSLQTRSVEQSVQYQEHESVQPLDEMLLPHYEEFVTFFVAFQAIFFSHKYSGQEFTVRITHGADFYLDDPDMNDVTLRGNVENNFLTIYCPRVADWKYGYGIVERTNKIPCASVNTYFPNICDRVKRTNCLQKGIFSFSQRVTKCQNLIEMSLKDRAVKEYKQALKCILDFCKDYRKKAVEEPLRKRISGLQKSIKRSLSLPRRSIVDEIKNSSFYIDQLQDCMDDSNTLFPDLQITVFKKQKCITSHTIQTENFFYSDLREERGSRCGNLQTMWLCDLKQKAHIGLIECFMWFGPRQQFNNCIEMLDYHGSDVPLILQLPEHHKFQLRIHVYEGQFFIATGLTDSFVRIVAFGQYSETQVQRNTLHPVWDETLSITPLYIPGTTDFIKRHSCGILIEVIDNDTHSTVIGRTFTRPHVVFGNEKYKAPQMKWHTIQDSEKDTGQILLASEWVETNRKQDELSKISEYNKIPENIRPHYVNCRLEVIFWGLRNVSFINPNKVFAIIEYNETHLESNVVHNLHNVDFEHVVQFAPIRFPEEAEFSLVITVSLYETNWMSKPTLKATGSISSRAVFMPYVAKRFISYDLFKFKANKTTPKKKVKEKRFVPSIIPHYLKSVFRRNARSPDDEDDGISDWWSRYYAAKNMIKKPKHISLIKIYNEELEVQKKFNEFQDFLMSVLLIKSKGYKKRNEGLFKGAIKIYPEDLAERELSQGLFSSYLMLEQKEITVRVYVISAINLLTSTECNPYVSLTLGHKTIQDNANYVYRDHNPTFGRVFELKGVLPRDNSLRIRILDHSTFLSNDLIGETIIDLENRFYTRHYAACGIPKNYNNWRDHVPPSAVLRRICRQANIPDPIFTSSGNLLVGGKTYRGNLSQEEKALEALKQFHMLSNGFPLVPEHIETRCLLHPGDSTERGKLELWIDLFPGHADLPPPIEITRRKPLFMELRVIVWNTEKIFKMNTSILKNDKSSDYYVKGWLTSPEKTQRTDVHLRSIDGYGKFNWRFIFRFVYSSSERKMLTKHSGLIGKSSVDKVPCQLHLQLWEIVHLLTNDRIGSLSLDLLDMPIGAGNAKKCDLKMFNSKYQRINLFRVKKIRGWWPFTNSADKEKKQQARLSGKVELELQLLGEEEARNSPAGRGREGPQKLPKPNRPDFRLFGLPYFLDIPLKFFKSLFSTTNCHDIMPYLLIAMLVIFAILAFMSLPSLIMQKIINAI